MSEMNRHHQKSNSTKHRQYS